MQLAPSAPVTNTPDGSLALRAGGKKSFFEKYWMYIIAILIGLRACFLRICLGLSGTI